MCAGSLRQLTGLQSPQPTGRSSCDTAALAALGTDISTACATRLARTSGTHGLFLDGIGMPVPVAAGIACWTTLNPSGTGPAWQGPLRAAVGELPFADDSFCAVLVGFKDAADVSFAPELARVLAPHGRLLVAGLHPRSLWRCGVAPRRWERALRRAGLDVLPAVRCGAPWPRARGDAGLPRWLVRSVGGAWIVEARRSVLAALPLRRTSAHRVVEHSPVMPGARRQCA
jgi:SAM-dependent methyltransferase